MTAFRPVPDTDRDRMQSILRYAFSPQRGPLDPDDDDQAPSELFDDYGLYDDELVACCKLYTPEARLRGEIRPIGALGAVATRPERRGEGHAETLCRNVLAEYRDRGIEIVTLWPFSTPFYGRMGWGTANQLVRYEFNPEVLPSCDPAGRIREIDGDDWQALRSIEAETPSVGSLSLRRSEGWWRERTLANWTGGTEPYRFGYERDGDLTGALVYTVSDDGSRTLTVSYAAAVDEDAYRALLDFLGGHGAQIGRIAIECALDTGLLNRVENPDEINCEVVPGPMVRLTDVPALERLPWPDVDFNCKLAVTDPLVNRNEAVYRLSVADGEATVERLSDEAQSARERGKTTAESPDARVDIATLSQLVVGTQGVDDAERVGGLDLRNESIRDPLAEVFRPRSVGLREFF